VNGVLGCYPCKTGCANCEWDDTFEESNCLTCSVPQFLLDDDTLLCLVNDTYFLNKQIDPYCTNISKRFSFDTETCVIDCP